MRTRSSTRPDRETAQRTTWHVVSLNEQALPDEFADHEAALRDYAQSTEPGLVARVVGEVHELLALDLDDAECALALAELGMEVDPPALHTPGAWLEQVAGRLTGPRGEYGLPERPGE
ncbi:contact-dependent growth inhibition system immunity protein [Streptomyces sp. CC210A]|uniref:contact-dependent growth inhibition system immunity protein n=1 Tax=Streptomyces sp. CC210A TaxID=2898184 RepID=UPI001EEC398F|nr:contact-dependent growth inhibition system immunity protein [Streptomyces sp. CC210A]